MKTIQNVLREKEAEIEKLTREIKMLTGGGAHYGRGRPGPGSAGGWNRCSATWMSAAVNLEEPVLDVLPVAGPSNGDSSKRWP